MSADGEYDDATIIQLLEEKLPYKRTEDDHKKRMEQFNGMDKNGNGYLSLAEIDLGMKDVVQLPQLFATKPVLLRAYNAARKKSPSFGVCTNNDNNNNNTLDGDDYVTKEEYRYLLYCLRQYYECYLSFQKLDKNKDHKITKEEFTKMMNQNSIGNEHASPLKHWIIDNNDTNTTVDALFEEIDTNKGGAILYEEFCAWALQKYIDLTPPTTGSANNNSNNKEQQQDGCEETLQFIQEQEAIMLEIEEKLPYKRTPEDYQKRMQQFRDMDGNGSGRLSLAEIDLGMKTVVKLPQLFETKTVLMRAYQAAKNRSGGGDDEGNDDDSFVTKNEYRYLLYCLRQYYECYLSFSKLDKNDDKRISQSEFVTMLHNNITLQKWVIGEGDNTNNDDDDDKEDIIIDTDPEALFQKMDKNNGGYILFDEFASWVLQNNNIDIIESDSSPVPQQHHHPKKSNDESDPPKNDEAEIEKLMQDLETTMQLLDDKLPYQKNNQEAYQKRMQQFRAMDVNGNGYLSLAEIDLGMKTVVALPQLFDTKPVLIRAYNAARNKAPAKFGNDDNYVTKNEYRFLLYCLRQYYEYYLAFRQADTTHDKRINKIEFQAVMTTILHNDQLKNWLFGKDNDSGSDSGTIPDVDALFDKIDTNKGGYILFDEFASWAIENNMDMEPENHIDIEQTDAKPKPYSKKSPKKNDTADVTKLMQDFATTMKLLDDKLPYQKNNKKAYKKRMDQFKAMDVNGNGFLSLAEIDLGMKTVVQIPQLFETKPVLIRAYNAARKKSPAKFGNDDDYVTKNEYRYLLYCLRQYYEYYFAFVRIDQSHDKRINKEEFSAVIAHVKSNSTLKSWLFGGQDIPSSEELFNKIDTNQGGSILFDEFASWAIETNLDLESDTHK